MQDSLEKALSGNPNAPTISHSAYFTEKSDLAGCFISAILYGVAIVMFLQCMLFLLNPVERIKWVLVVHSAVMFSVVTIQTAMILYIHSISFIDNRGFTGNSVLPPGPYGYQRIIRREPTAVVSEVLLVLNDWLANGLLLYRCYIIYIMNRWAIALPCLVYLFSLVCGILDMYQRSESIDTISFVTTYLGLPYYLVSLSLNVLLTIMIVARLILHRRNTRHVMGGSDGTYKIIISAVAESSALFAVSLLLYIGSWSRSSTTSVFSPILAEGQVIAPFFITLRVANRTRSTGGPIVLGGASSIYLRSRGKSMDDLPDGYPMSPNDTYGEPPGSLAAGGS